MEQPFGEKVPIEKKVIFPHFIIEGDIEANQIKIKSFPSCTNIDTIVGINDEIRENQILFFCNQKPIISDFSGKIAMIEVEITVKIKYYDYQELSLKVQYSQDELIMMEPLTNQNTTLEYIYTSRELSDENERIVYYKINDVDAYIGERKRYYFQEATSLNAYTVVKQCVYQDVDNKQYIRVIDQMDKVIGHVPILILAEDYYEYAINFNEDGMYCDVEYGKYKNQLLENKG